MFQQLIAIVVILFFLSRLFIQRRRKEIGANEFVFWLVFWLLAAVFISALKWIDKLVAELGFSGSGIEVMLYIAVAVLFYFIFKLRLRLEKMERDMTKIVRELSIKK